jgi:hypothetical protein
MPLKLFAATVLLVSTAAVGQTSATPAPKPAAQPAPLVGSLKAHPEWPVARAADVDSVDHLLAALYDVISGPAGQPRDWDRFRSLFLPDGHLGVIRPATPAASGKPASEGDVILITPQMYIDRDDPYFKAHGFFEHSIANRVEQFGNLTAVWSTYESRNAASDAKPFERGVNSLQIAHAAGRYWIVSIVWDQEREGLTLPEKYLR